MRFTLIDRVAVLVPGERLEAVKAVSLAEEYLADHFPTFPVLPGVFMLEALTQASAWLVRASTQFSASSAVILLREARNVRYRSFVQPGRLMRIVTQVRRLEPAESEFTAYAEVEGVETVNARLRLTHRPAPGADAVSQQAESLRLCAHFRTLWGLLYHPPSPTVS